MTTETEYQNAVNYLTRLLSGGLMGERGSKPLRIAIEACELQIPKQPISKSWSPNLCPHCDADLGGDCTMGTTRIHIMSDALFADKNSNTSNRQGAIVPWELSHRIGPNDAYA